MSSQSSATPEGRLGPHSLSQRLSRSVLQGWPAGTGGAGSYRSAGVALALGRHRSGARGSPGSCGERTGRRVRGAWSAALMRGEAGPHSPGTGTHAIPMPSRPAAHKRACRGPRGHRLQTRKSCQCGDRPPCARRFRRARCHSAGAGSASPRIFAAMLPKICSCGSVLGSLAGTGGTPTGVLSRGWQIPSPPRRFPGERPASLAPTDPHLVCPRRAKGLHWR